MGVIKQWFYRLIFPWSHLAVTHVLPSSLIFTSSPYDIDAGVKKPGKLWEQQGTVISSRQTLCHFHKSSPARWPCIGLHYFKHQIVVKITIILICEIWKRPYLLNREKKKWKQETTIYFSWLSCFPISLAIVITLPSKFTTWSGGVGTNFIIFEDLQGQAKKALIGKLRTGCGCFYMVDTTGTWDEDLFFPPGW